MQALLHHRRPPCPDKGMLQFAPSEPHRLYSPVCFYFPPGRGWVVQDAQSALRDLLEETKWFLCSEQCWILKGTREIWGNYQWAKKLFSLCNTSPTNLTCTGGKIKWSQKQLRVNTGLETKPAQWRPPHPILISRFQFAQIASQHQQPWWLLTVTGRAQQAAQHHQGEQRARRLTSE